MDVTATLNQAIAAAKAGHKAEARRLLEAVLEADERNEKAWLWLSATVESDEERSICLENVLTINPHNEMARKGLVALRATPSGPAPRAESPDEDSLAGQPPVADNRAFIVITLVLALMLICIVGSILAFVIFSPLG